MESAPTSPIPTTPANPPGVSFARRSARGKVAIGDEGAMPRFALMATVVVAGGLALWVASRTVAAMSPPAALAATIVAIAVGVVLLPALGASVAGYNTPRSWRSLPKNADEADRVHVLCPRERLERFGPLEDTDFEPEYERLLLVMPRGWVDGVIIAAFVIAGFPLGLVLQRLGIHIPGPFGFYVLWTLGLATLAMMRQTYVRISPGRLDVLRFTIWRDRADVCRTYDLRTQPVVIDLRRRRVVVGGRPVEHWAQGLEREQAREGRAMADAAKRLYKPEQQPVSVSFLGTLRPAEVAFHLARAAISTAPSPDLPVDQLHH